MSKVEKKVLSNHPSLRNATTDDAALQVIKGLKDNRSFRPSSLEELNLIRGYKPFIVTFTGFNGKKYEVPVLFGNSVNDFIFVILSLISIWAFLLGLFALTLKATLDTDRLQTTIWIFLFIFFIAYCMIFLASYLIQARNKSNLDAAQLSEQKSNDSDDKEPSKSLENSEDSDHITRAPIASPFKSFDAKRKGVNPIEEKASSPRSIELTLVDRRHDGETSL